MRHILNNLLPSLAVALTVAGFSLPVPARAQTYPIDCAILLCLSGGWPASEPCARARAEFIRRITPMPVEPPLQIWRCPMGVSHKPSSKSYSANRVFEAFLPTEGYRSRQSFPVFDSANSSKAAEALWHSADTSKDLLPADHALQLIQDRADIDISGPEFNFVRSIRVFDIRHATQGETGKNGECRRYANIYLGTYGTQGDFSWRQSSPFDLPEAHRGFAGWGEDCPVISNRSVFVDWRDYEGNYGFELVSY